MNHSEIVKRYFDEIWNKRNFTVAEEIISNSLVTRFPKSHGKGGKGLINVVNSRYKVFPDLKMKILDMVSEGSKVWINYEFNGTHKGTFWGIMPTNKKIKFEGILLEISEGKVTSGGSVRDELALLEQIGYLNLKRDDKQ